MPAAAISPQQSTVTNNQDQSGQTTVSNTLNVVDVWNDVSQTTAATGNTFTGSVVGVDLNVVSTQSMSNSATATARLNATGSIDGIVVQTTAATGNDGDSNVDGAGTLNSRSTQVFTGSNVLALGEFNGGDAHAAAITSSNQAVANSQGYGVTSSTANYTVNQSSGAIVESFGGGTVGYTDGTALFSALAASNNVTGTGIEGSTQNANVTQTMNGQRTQASVFTNVGTGQDLITQTTVTANNINITNQYGPLSVVSNQSNDGFVLSQGVMTAYEFGSAQVNAYGVGNSVMAGNVGPSVDINNTQNNFGDGVEAQASFTAGGGYDAAVAATAIGNAITGFACTSCGGRMTVNNRQTNTADVGATANASIAGYNRTTTATATATGNSASFYVSNPN